MSNSVKREKRRVNGILLLDKPQGLTSNAALQKVKWLFKAKKAGHTGSLDPLATGMLPLCFGEATKFSQYLLDADKTYVVKAKLGVRTNTSDADGEVVSERDVPTLSLDDLEQHLQAFRGEIDQVPSMFSALKHNGTPLYKLARQGIEVERPSRRITVFSNRILSFEDNILELEIHCTKGTYIRTIVDDLGEALGCGAHVISLRRTKVASYPQDQMITLDEIEALFDDTTSDKLDHLLLPVDTAVSHWPMLCVNPDMARYLRHGQAVQVAKAPTEGWVRLANKDGEIFGVGEIQDDGLVAPKRLFARG